LAGHTPGEQAPQATTPSQPDFETRLQAEVARKQRDWQAAKDREIARVHQQYQAQLNKTVSKTKEVLTNAGVRDADAYERQMVNEMELEEYRAYKQQAAAQSATFDYGTGILKDIAARYEVELDEKDPALWVPANSWEEFTERARKAAQEKVRAKREAERQAEEEAKRKAVDSRIASGNLDTLGVTPAGASTQDEFANYSPKDAGKLWEIGNRRTKGAKTRR